MGGSWPSSFKTGLTGLWESALYRSRKHLPMRHALHATGGRRGLEEVAEETVPSEEAARLVGATGRFPDPQAASSRSCLSSFLHGAANLT